MSLHPRLLSIPVITLAGLMTLALPVAAQDDETPAPEAPSEQPAEPGEGQPNEWPPPGTGGEGEDAEPDEESGATRGYDPEGRRDPFRPLVGVNAQPETDRPCDPYALECIAPSELKLTAIVKTPTGNIATFEGGPQRLGYFARVGTLMKGARVHDIDYENLRVVIREDLDDPRLIKPYRDVPLTLYREDERAAGGVSVVGAAGRR
jgi:hypothetical protein